VEFAEPEHVDAALAMDGSLFRGRLLKVRPVRLMPDFQMLRSCRSLLSGQTSQATIAEEAGAVVDTVAVSGEAIEATAHIIPLEDGMMRLA
jgi:hypothetical protein